jgi:hypothetical protein
MTFGIKGIVITSLDDDVLYHGDDEGQQQQPIGTKPTTRETDFTISPAFLNAINRKLTQAVDHTPPLPTDTHPSQALVLFRPLPLIAPPSVSENLKDIPGHREGALDLLIQKPSSSPPSVSSPFRVQDSFVSNDDDMEIEML